MTDRDEFVGRFKVVSRLPQYLWEESVGFGNGMRSIVLDHRNVHWGCCARTINAFVSHDELYYKGELVAISDSSYRVL